jgi:hypothetical protein
MIIAHLPRLNTLFFKHHELFYRFAMRGLIPMERVADGDDGHELKALRQLEQIENPLLILQNFPDPGRSEAMGMHRQQEILHTGTDGLAVLDAIVGTVPVQKSAQALLSDFGPK